MNRPFDQAAYDRALAQVREERVEDKAAPEAIRTPWPAILFGTAPIKPSILSQVMVGAFVVGVLSLTVRPGTPGPVVLLFGWIGAGVYRQIFIEALNR